MDFIAIIGSQANHLIGEITSLHNLAKFVAPVVDHDSKYCSFNHLGKPLEWAGIGLVCW